MFLTKAMKKSINVIGLLFFQRKLSNGIPRPAVRLRQPTKFIKRIPYTRVKIADIFLLK